MGGGASTLRDKEAKYKTIDYNKDGIKISSTGEIEWSVQEIEYQNLLDLNLYFDDDMPRIDTYPGYFEIQLLTDKYIFVDAPKTTRFMWTQISGGYELQIRKMNAVKEEEYENAN